MVNRPKKELKEDAVDLRREKVLELTSQGYSQRQIATMLSVASGTVANDQIYLRQKAKVNIRRYVDERLPEEYERCLVGITSILREAWNIFASKQENIENREKIRALSLAKECYSMKLDLLTNATVVDDAISFVSSNKSKDTIRSSGHNDEVDKEKSKEPDYDEDKDQLEEEQEQEEQTAEEISSSTTTNQIF